MHARRSTLIWNPARYAAALPEAVLSRDSTPGKSADTDREDQEGPLE